MMKDIRYFIAQNKFNFKNAYVLKGSFWIGVWSMILNNTAFFVMWILFMNATGPINGWNSFDVFGMLGIAMFCYGVAHSFFFGIKELPDLVLRGAFDNVLLSPVNSLIRLAGYSFSVIAFGDLFLGGAVFIVYGLYLDFTLYAWFVYLFSIFLGCVVFICFRLLSSLIVFFIHDGEVVSTQVFEMFLRPGLYPGSIFPDKLKIVCMTILPTLLTSAVPIDVVKVNSLTILLVSVLVTIGWIFITAGVYSAAVKRYESGNFLR